MKGKGSNLGRSFLHVDGKCILSRDIITLLETHNICRCYFGVLECHHLANFDKKTEMKIKYCIL